MTYADRSLIVHALHEYRAWRKYRTRRDGYQRRQPASTFTAPSHVTVIFSSRGYWKGPHYRDGHSWAKKITGAYPFRTDDLATYYATSCALERIVQYRLETHPYPFG